MAAEKSRSEELERRILENLDHVIRVLNIIPCMRDWEVENAAGNAREAACRAKTDFLSMMERIRQEACRMA